MSERDNRPDSAQTAAGVRPEVVQQVKRFFESRHHLRRGICLLNAGCNGQAVKSFSEAMRLNPDSANLQECLVRAHMGSGDYPSAAQQIARIAEGDPDDITSRIRHAMLLWKNGDCQGGIASLRRSIAAAPDCAELHFQLGNLLADVGQDEEAQMRFTLAVELDSRHVDALVNLALCHAACQEPARALRILRKAQSLRPQDARIGLLLGMASRAAGGHDRGGNGLVTMPSGSKWGTEQAADALLKIIEGDPDFVDAFTGLPADEIDQDLYRMLSETLHRAIERRPDAGDLHLHYGSVLERLGHIDRAIAATENTLALDPQHIPALIQLARLYQKANRCAEATDQLEETLRLGARYADVYMLLGRLYRDSGRAGQARQAYRHALDINEDYEEARAALQTLPA